MAEWWRSWHGAPTDPKWRLIAKDSGRPVAEVVAVAWMLLDSASQHVTRGHADGLDPEVTADFLNAEPDHVEAIIAAMRKRRIIEDGRVRSWDKRQPKREDDTAAERKRKQRQRDSGKNANVVTPRDKPEQDDVSRNVTHGHAPVTTEQNREEQNREEQIYTQPPVPTSAREPDRSADASLGGGRVDDPLFEDLVKGVFERAGLDLARRSARTDAWLAGWAERLSHRAILDVVETRTRSMKAQGDPPRSLKAFDDGLGRAVEERQREGANVHTLDVASIAAAALKRFPKGAAE